jgi:hypothetical protein
VAQLNGLAPWGLMNLQVDTNWRRKLAALAAELVKFLETILGREFVVMTRVLPQSEPLAEVLRACHIS